MGLLSFLSKQSLGDRSRPDASPRSQAYHATVASSPPVKGTYPVPGNGTNVIKGFSRIRSKLSESQLSLNFSTPSEITPLPSVPRLRDESLQRPSTAPIGSNPTTESQPNVNRLRKSNSRGRPPPLSFKKGRKSSLASGSSQGSPKPAASPATKPGLRPRLLVASSPVTSVRNDAVKGSKDILDAQSELKPLDFKTRVKAAGVRDYGEDVADRNIGQNGVDLESAEVQEFYARSADNFINRRSRCASMADISSQYFNNDDTRGRPATKRTSTGSGLRAKSLGSSTHLSFPQGAPPPIPQMPASIAADPTPTLVSRPSVTTSIGRRLSLTSYTTPTGPVEPHRPSSFRRTLSLQRADLPRRSSLLLANERTSQHHSRSSQEPQRQSSLSTVRQPSIPRAPRSPNRRDSASTAQKQPDHREADPNLEYVRPRQRSFSLTSRRDSRRDSVGSATFGYAGSRHGTHPSISSSITSRETATENIGVAHTHDISRFSSPYDERNVGATSTITGLGISASDDLDLGKPFATRATPGSPNGHTRTRSLASSLRTLKMDEISDVIPVRTSSIRHWSISSTTPTTTSDTSSNPSQRPQSRHTADTSVDLRTSFSAKNSSLGSLASVIAPGSAAVSPKSTKSPAFNIDDYISSDDDYDTPRRPRGEGEEDLLFQDNGYGMNGSLLPGLSDGMPLPGLSSFVPLSPEEIPRPRTSSSLPPGYLHNAFGSPTFSPGPISHSRSRRYVIDTAAHYDDDVDGDDDYLYREEPSLPGLSPMRGGGPGSRGTKRFTALGKMYDGHHRPSSSSSYHHHGHHHGHHHHHHRGGEDVIEEERDMSKIDIAAAVRMRKEAKARMRADIAAARRRRPSKARRRRSIVGPDADEEHHADTEC